MYTPHPLDTSDVDLPEEIIALSEQLSENIHDVWAEGRIRDGWTYGEHRDDVKKCHPCLVEYDKLTEKEKDYDRNTMLQALKAIYTLGFKIVKDNNKP